MEMRRRPTIKGIFVNSHVHALRKARGDEAVLELQGKFGKPVSFGVMEDVLVCDEVLLLEYIVEIMSHRRYTDRERSLEAGRLHFNNFTTTPLWKVLISTFGNDFKRIALHGAKVTEQVFRGLSIKIEDIGPTHVKITMGNNDYPLEHFQGFYEAWLASTGTKAAVEGNELHGPQGDGPAQAGATFEYIIRWV